MKKITRVVSVLLASVMLASFAFAFGGCSKTKKEAKPEFIAEDQPWFDSTKIEMTIPYDEKEFEYINFSDPAYLDGYIYTVFQGYKYYDVKAEEDEDFDYDSTMIKTILQYDLEGNFVKELLLGNDDYRVGYCSGITTEGDKLKITCEAYDKKELCYLTAQLLLDPETNELERKCIDIELNTMEEIQGEYQVGDKTVYLVADYSSSTYKFVIAGEKTKTVSVNAAVEDLMSVDSCIVIDDNTLIGFCYGKGSQTIELDVDKGEIHKTDIDIDTIRYTFFPVQDGKAYAANSEGVFTINDKLEIENVLDYDNAFVNISDLNYATPLYVDDDTIIVFTNLYLGSLSKRTVYAFKRAESNPNVGKQIIDVYSLIPYVSYAEAEAILKFNQESSDYYATMRFSDYDFGGSDDVEMNNSFAQTTNQLIVDIMSGDGPDIVLNGFSSSEFNNPDYFVDLNSMIAADTNYDADKYFDNIIKASQSDDGGLYQIPASFSIDAIMAKVSDVGEGHIGFTYESYEKFLDEVCNGVSPIKESRDSFLGLCISFGYFNYLKDGKVDFNSEEFRKACEFANKNFPEKLSDREETAIIIIGSGCGVLTEPRRMNLFDPGYLFSDIGGTPEAVGFYGFPFSEEHGPTALIGTSAAISATIDDSKKNACWDLIKIMLDDEVQESITDSFPMNKSALMKLLINLADDADKGYEAYVRMGYNDAEIAQFNFQRANRDIIDSLYNSVLSITDVSRSDSSLDIIVAEEIPAYFAGQKSFDEVVSIINDRAQTIYDERK